MNDVTLRIPEGHTFQIGDKPPFTLDIVDALQELNRISRECQAAGANDFEYADKFRDWLEKQTGQKFTKGQADRIADACKMEFAREKKAVQEALSSPNSSDPPPSSSELELDLPSMHT